MADNLLIEATKNTPKFSGDIQSCSILIEGSSFPENVRRFYDTISEWIDTNLKFNNTPVTIVCKFYYMASSSVIAFLKTLKKIENIFGKDNIKITWMYEEGDDDILKIGEDYSQLLNIPFTYEEVKEEY